MSTEEGIVTRIQDDKAWVMVKRSEMCDHCQSKTACHSLGGDMDMETEAINEAGAGEGDRVRLHLESSSLLKIASVFYLVPLVFLILGAFLGKLFTPGSDGGAIAGSVILLLISIIPVKLLSNSIKDKKNYIPKIVEIRPPLSKSNQSCE
jgi:sigma-E factor negative regulatory protein RseC